MKFLKNLALISLISFLCMYCAEKPIDKTPTVVHPIQINTTSLIQAISTDAADGSIWISGHHATWGLSKDGGNNFKMARFTGEDSLLQFRDIHGIDSLTAYMMSAGEGDKSRIYKTINGGQSWQRQYIGFMPEVFLNTIEFWSPDSGLALGDSFNEQFFVLQTTNGGQSWERIERALPKAQKGEGGFAASGSCIQLFDGGYAHIITGNGAHSRILSTKDYGHSWDYSFLPITAGDAAGAISISGIDPENLAIFGGNIGDADATKETVLFSRAFGQKHAVLEGVPFKGAVYGGYWAHTDNKDIWFAAGPSGLAATNYPTMQWQLLDSLNYWVVEGNKATNNREVFAAGPKGRLVKIYLDSLSLP